MEIEGPVLIGGVISTTVRTVSLYVYMKIKGTVLYSVFCFEVGGWGAF